MANAREIVEKHVKAALEEAAANKYPRDSVARVLFDEVIKLYKMDRSPEDIASELTAAAENMDADDGIAFMRP
jgi:HEPN domain-containing protein